MNHDLKIEGDRINRSPDEKDVDRIAQLLASWYVRMDGKYYDVFDPRHKFSRDDILAASLQRIQEDHADIVLTDALWAAATHTALISQTSQQSHCVATWNGKLECKPETEAKLLPMRGMVSINSWTRPSYRQLEVNQPGPGAFEGFFSSVFERDCDRDVFLNWLAWCLQHEDQKPTWGPILFSKSKGTGKSTLCDIVRALFGTENSIRQNNVDKLTSKFNMQLMTSKLIISEELQITPGTKAANALKTYMTETDASAEAKGRELEQISQCFCCIFTTNHLPMWIEEGDRRYWIVEVDHEGRSGGPQAAEFGECVAGVKRALDRDESIAGLYRWLMERDLPDWFDGHVLKLDKVSTPTMDLILGNGTKTTNDQMEEYLNAQNIDAIAEGDVIGFVTRQLGLRMTATKHVMTELGWRKHKAKWGGKDYARAIWLRPGASLDRGKLVAADGSTGRIYEADVYGGTQRAMDASQPCEIVEDNTGRNKKMEDLY